MCVCVCVCVLLLFFFFFFFFFMFLSEVRVLSPFTDQGIVKEDFQIERHSHIKCQISA